MILTNLCKEIKIESVSCRVPQLFGKLVFDAVKPWENKEYWNNKMILQDYLILLPVPHNVPLPNTCFSTDI